MSKTTTENAPETTAVESGVIAKLKKHKAEHSGTATFGLPQTGVEVTYPRFINHGQWSRAQRLAKKQFDKAQVIYICNVCRFDGEKLTVTDFDALIPTSDSMDLLSEIWGDGDDEDDNTTEDGAGNLAS